jgi:hypothetical protein
MKENECPVCHSDTKVQSDDRTFFFDCPRCGSFEVMDDACLWLEENPLSPQAAANLSGLLRESVDFQITPDNVQQLAKLPTPPLSDRAERLLLFLSREFPSVGLEIEFFPDASGRHVLSANLTNLKDLTAALPESRSADFEQVRYLLDGYLCEAMNYLKTTGAPFRYLITPAGWEWLERGNPNRESHRAFVAMSFDPALSTLYSDGIKPAVEAAGYSSLRIDQHEHVNRIDDEILAGIRRSRFCVADFTQQRAGVYFEAGFALGLRLIVIWTCSKPELKNVHFDARQYNMVTWEEGKWADFRKRLTHRIIAMLGTGPLLVSDQKPPSAS